jgi:hypothetical protein
MENRKRTVEDGQDDQARPVLARDPRDVPRHVPTFRFPLSSDVQPRLSLFPESLAPAYAASFSTQESPVTPSCSASRVPACAVPPQLPAAAGQQPAKTCPRLATAEGRNNMHATSDQHSFRSLAMNSLKRVCTSRFAAGETFPTPG